MVRLLVTEPPEPRRPEEGDGDEDWDGIERDAVRDFVADSTPDMQEAIDAARAEYGDEQFDEMVAEVIRRANDPDREPIDPFTPTDEDDVLLDVLGSGDDVEDGGELTDMLSSWRDDVDSEPVSPGTAPEVVQDIHDFTQEIDRATAPPRTPQEGSSPVMALSEVIAQLQMVAANSSAEGPLAQASAKLEGEVLPLLMQAVEQLVEIKNTGVAALEGNVNTHGELNGTAEHAAGAIEDAIELVQNAKAGVDQAVQHEAAFRQTALDIANRLSG